MTTRTRNIYPIAVARCAALLGLLTVLLALSAAPVMAQCDDIGGAGDEYCETLPGPDRDRGPSGASAGGGSAGGGGGAAGGAISPTVDRALKRAGAGAVSTVKSPRAQRDAPTPARAGTGLVEEPGGNGSMLPWILAGLAAILGIAALARRRSASHAADDPAG